MTKNAMAVLVALGLAVGISSSAHAVTQFVQNGSFETLTTTPGGSTAGTAGQLDFNTYATGWSNTVNGNVGYNFVFSPTTLATTSGTIADNGGANGVDGNLQLWGPGNGSANGLTKSPDGGNFVAADGAYEVEPLTQTITGLTVGQNYAVNFWWAGAQQSGFSGPTTDLWTVGLNPVGQSSDTQSTGTVSLPSHGFTGWQQQTFNYTATSNTEVLSFLATGTPNGEPPFALLDGVSMIATPEPSSFITMGVGALVLGMFIRRRVRSNKDAA